MEKQLLLPMPLEDFKRSLNRIKCGNTEEFARVCECYELSLPQLAALQEAHEKAVKTNQ